MKSLTIFLSFFVLTSAFARGNQPRPANFKRCLSQAVVKAELKVRQAYPYQQIKKLNVATDVSDMQLAPSSRMNPLYAYTINFTVMRNANEVLTGVSYKSIFKIKTCEVVEVKDVTGE